MPIRYYPQANLVFQELSKFAQNWTQKRCAILFHYQCSIKAGPISDSAVCVTERAYVQGHAIAGSIQRQQVGLIAEHLARCMILSAESGVSVSHPASRNALRVYTDRGGGVQIGPYKT